MSNQLPKVTNPDREHFVDLKPETYILLANKIKAVGDWAVFTGEVNDGVEISKSTQLFGAVNSGGYENLLDLNTKLGECFKGHSFDLSVFEPETEANLRIYDGRGHFLEIHPISEQDSYVPFWSYGGNIANDAESPNDDHAKLSVIDMQAVLWGLVNTGNDGDFDMLDADLSLREVTQMAIDKAEPSASRVIKQIEFSTNGFDEFIDDPLEPVPGSRLQIVKTTERTSEKNVSSKTNYLLTTRFPEVHEVKIDNKLFDVWIWIICSFNVEINENGTIEHVSAVVDVCLQNPADIENIPSDKWMVDIRKEHQRQITPNFSGFMSDALGALFKSNV